jgi:hypothetical protein
LVRVDDESVIGDASYGQARSKSKL